MIDRIVSVALLLVSVVMIQTLGIVMRVVVPIARWWTRPN